MTANRRPPRQHARRDLPGVAIVGAGPAGLAAAEELAAAGFRVDIYERMPSPARKFLLAGRGGLNLTHSEPLGDFLARYRPLPAALRAAVEGFPPDALRLWAGGLGEETFTGSSGRVFPRSFKATPLLRAWLRRLADLGVRFHFRHEWTGWRDDGALRFATPEGEKIASPAATLLALGGASWPRLGSDGGWVPLLAAREVAIAPLAPSNAGVRVAWTPVFRDRFQGMPLKRIAITCDGETRRGEAIVTAGGLEGGPVYALSAAIRAALTKTGAASLNIDLRPDIGVEALGRRLAAGRAAESLSNRLRKAGFAAAMRALLREGRSDPLPADSGALASLAKSLPVRVTGLAGFDRAISTAGGVAFDAIEADFSLERVPGTWIAGEMLDWDAPTGGYLLQACFATGVAAARGIARKLESGRSAGS